MNKSLRILIIPEFKTLIETGQESERVFNAIKKIIPNSKTLNTFATYASSGNKTVLGEIALSEDILAGTTIHEGAVVNYNFYMKSDIIIGMVSNKYVEEVDIIIYTSETSFALLETGFKDKQNFLPKTNRVIIAKDWEDSVNEAYARTVEHNQRKAFKGYS